MGSPVRSAVRSFSARFFVSFSVRLGVLCSALQPPPPSLYTKPNIYLSIYKTVCMCIRCVYQQFASFAFFSGINICNAFLHSRRRRSQLSSRRVLCVRCAVSSSPSNSTNQHSQFAPARVPHRSVIAFKCTIKRSFCNNRVFFFLFFFSSP